jgi:hypothetical protein
MRNEADIEARIAALNQEVKQLERRLATKPIVRRLRSRGRPPKTELDHAPVVEPAQSSRKRRRRTRAVNRKARVTIAPGVKLTTNPGTMYSSICRCLAEMGKLRTHEQLFNAFEKEPTPSSALAVLQQIGVKRTEVEEAVRHDPEFRAHCVARTMRYQKAAAAGNKRYFELLSNRAICDEKGNWHGNFDEAISTLYGARTLTQVHRGKNVRILDKAGLMFDTFLVGDQQLCFLYQQKWYRVFKRAMALLKS